MDYITVNLNSASEEELTLAIKENSHIYHMMQREIAKLKQASISSETKTKFATFEKSNEQALEESENSDIDEEFEDEVEYYYQALKDIKTENLEREIDFALPSRKNYQYERIMMRLIAEHFRVIKEIKDFINTEKVSLEEAFLSEEFNLTTKRLEILKDRLFFSELDMESIKAEKNNLIFVPTQSGNIRILDEIDHIDSEYYERFAGLFQSIIDGTFRNVRRFSRNSNLAGLCEVKDFKTRVLFKRLNGNSYAIISAFIKKSDNDKGYRNMVSSYYSDYLTMEDNIKSKLDDPSFLNLHLFYTEELFNKISPYTSSKVKTKGDE